MKTLGLTGGVGMGKSTAAHLLTGFGVPVIDTDLIARQVVEPGQPALAEIRNRFGAEVFSNDGHLRRDLLAKRVFADPEERQALEAILHPRIRKAWQEQRRVWDLEKRALAVVVIPLLFETNASDQFTATLCLACSPTTQLSRLKERGWSDLQAGQRIQAQWPIERKMAAADFVIWTEGSIEVHSQQLRQVLKALGLA